MQIEMIDAPVESPADKAITIVNTSVAELSALDVGFAELERRYKDVVYAVDTTAGMEDAKKARLEIRAVRYKAQEIIKTTKKALNRAKSDLESDGEKVVLRVSAIEDPIDAQIKAQEDKKAMEKAAAELLASEAAAKVDANFALLAFNPMLANATSYDIATVIERIELVDVTLEAYGDRAGEAAVLKAATLEQLQALYDARYKHEVEQSKVLEAQRQVEAERKRMEDQMAAFRAEQEAAAAAAAEVLRKQRDAFLAEQEAFNAKLAKQQADEEAQRKAISDAAEAERAAAQKVLDDAAAAERKRLDDIAAAERAEQARVLQEKRDADLAEMQKQMAAAAEKRMAEERVYGAAYALLGVAKAFSNAMRGMNDTPVNEDHVLLLQRIVDDARAVISKATGEQA